MHLQPRASRPRRRARTRVALVGLLATSLLAAGCGGAQEGSEGGDADRGAGGELARQGLTVEAGESGLEDAGGPVRGGTLIYGLEADSNSGFCLSEGQLAISGMMVVRAIYDTLTVPNAEGGYSPYLAESVEPNDDFSEWTITVREGITFHDGSDLTAEVVKNNIDAYRGVYPGRSSLLGAFVLENIDTVTAVDDRTVVVTTTVPWVAFPAFLYGSSRFGIMAQSQLDDPDSCARQPVGTGPFVFESWTPNQKLTATANPDYWQTAPDGEPYPYVDRIEFRPITDGQVRNNALEAGDVNVIHTSTSSLIGGKLKDLRDDGKVNMLVSEASAEVSFVQLNHTVPPFDDPNMRKAFAMGGDRDEINRIISGGLPSIADGPFAPDSPAHLEDTGFPEYDLEAAKALVQEYVDGGGTAEFTLTSTTDATVKKLAGLIQQRAKALGIDVEIVLRDQAALINDAIGKKYQAMVFRNHPGGDPDGNYVWWYSGTTAEDGTFSPNLVNFAGIRDEEVDRLLDEGRSEPDPDERKRIYQDLNRRMASELHALWFTYTPWAIATAADVHGILGPPLPGADPGEPGEATTDDPARRPNQGLATGHSLIGMWVEE